MNGILKWIESLICFMVISSCVTLLVPDKSYKKLFSFFTGLIIMVLVCAPVCKALSMDVPKEIMGLLDFDIINEMGN